MLTALIASTMVVAMILLPGSTSGIDPWSHQQLLILINFLIDFRWCHAMDSATDHDDIGRATIFVCTLVVTVLAPRTLRSAAAQPTAGEARR